MNSESANEQTRSLPLNGITVTSLEQAIAAPFCTRLLADLGAMIKRIREQLVTFGNRAELKKIICDAFAALSVEVKTPCGLVPALFPLGIGRASGVGMDRAPEVAQHNESILAELGM
ncbi:hypothetical protein F5X96DRAFT_669279 [Biscogniauxia mediterranea]|nr:hypothetical protein F5X96DRAFT_669279 [Biscogniauxia mediterranea]